MDADEAADLYLKRINSRIPVFETMAEKELNYVKMINAGQKFMYNNVSFNYLSHRIVFYLTNLHIKTRTTFFARAGTSSKEDSFKQDGSLGPEGESYALKMTETLLKHREQEQQAMIAQTGVDLPLRPLSVWTSTRLRTAQTAAPLKRAGYKIRQRPQMSQINPGVCEKMSERAIRHLYPDEVEKHELDPYHHRYPRAEVCIILSPKRLIIPSSRRCLVISRPCRPLGALHSRAGTRAKRPANHCPRVGPACALRLSHALQHHGYPKAQVPTR
jgi:6-phosphofructo-2-kinase / fructose-2,6-biphosphatase 4